MGARGIERIRHKMIGREGSRHKGRKWKGSQGVRDPQMYNPICVFRGATVCDFCIHLYVCGGPLLAVTHTPSPGCLQRRVIVAAG